MKSHGHLFLPQKIHLVGCGEFPHLPEIIDEIFFFFEQTLQVTPLPYHQSKDSTVGIHLHPYFQEYRMSPQVDWQALSTKVHNHELQKRPIKCQVKGPKFTENCRKLKLIKFSVLWLHLCDYINGWKKAFYQIFLKYSKEISLQ